MTTKVLVTGGAGYLGSIICEHLLNAGYKVQALDNLIYSQKSLFHLMANQNFDFVFGDVRDGDLTKKILKEADVVIPLAAIVGAPACEREPWTAEMVNLESIRMIIKNTSPSQIILYPTTNSGYGTQSGDVYCTEETPLEPISKYGQDKVQAEAEILNRGSSITLRLATVFGFSPRMRMDLLVNHFVWAAFSDGYLIIFEKDFKRNYIHIRDVADCFLHCIDHFDKMKDRPYNAGLDDANLSKEELASKVKEYFPKFYIHYSDIGQDPDKRNYIVSNQRLRESGFEASRSLDEGITELIKGYRMMVRLPFKNV